MRTSDAQWQRQHQLCASAECGSAEGRRVRDAPQSLRVLPLSIIDSPICLTNVVNLDRLATDLTSISTTPNLVFITPNLCDDGHDGDGTGAPGRGCADGRPGGLASADAFLASIVPKILASPAYQQDGMLLITFDESGYTTSTVTDTSTKQTTVKLVFRARRAAISSLGRTFPRCIRARSSFLPARA